MTNGNSTVEYAIPYETPSAGIEQKTATTISYLKKIPWTRVIVDVMLLAAMLVASSKLFAP